MTYTLDDGAEQPELPFDDDENEKDLRELVNDALNRRD